MNKRGDVALQLRPLIPGEGLEIPPFGGRAADWTEQKKVDGDDLWRGE